MTASPGVDRAGRPLRFLALVLGGWLAARFLMAGLPFLWSSAPVPTRPAFAARARPAPMIVGAVSEAVSVAAIPLLRTAADAPVARPGDDGGWTAAIMDGAHGRNVALRRTRGIMSAPQTAARGDPGHPGHGDRRAADDNGSLHGMAMPGASPRIGGRDESRWSGVGWMLWRLDGPPALAQGPLLGGSQAGVRLDYRLGGTPAAGLALYGRFTRALARPFAEEAALGVALRFSASVPIAVMIERRQRLGPGGRSGFALVAAGGFGPTPLGQGLDVEGYAQAGVIGLPGADAFADGQLSADYRLAGTAQTADIALGASLSGSAQPGAARLDIGPQLRLRVPIGPGWTRLTVQWRARIAGAARPRSGPAVTLLVDF